MEQEQMTNKIDEKMVELTDEEKEKLFPKEIIEPVEPVENQVNTLKGQLEQLQQEQMTNKIYARLNEDNIVVKLFSSVFETPLETDKLIEEGNEDYHAHVHLKYQLIDMNGNYNYKFENEKMVELTEEEKAKLFPKVEPVVEPSLEDKVQFLEDDNATLLFDLANKDARLNQLENDFADLLLNLGGDK